VADAPNDQNGYKKFLPNGERPIAPQMRRRIITIAIIAFILGLLIINSLFSRQNVKTITYSSLLKDAKSQSVDSASINNSNGVISGQLTNGTNYTTNGPVPALSSEVNTLKGDDVSVTFANPRAWLRNCCRTSSGSCCSSAFSTTRAARHAGR
jgi:cell division protease FtsH